MPMEPQLLLLRRGCSSQGVEGHHTGAPSHAWDFSSHLELGTNVTAALQPPAWTQKQWIIPVALVGQTAMGGAELEERRA